MMTSHSAPSALSFLKPLRPALSTADLGERRTPATRRLLAPTDLVPGPLARDITITCTLERLPSGAELLVAVAAGTLPNWVVPVKVHVHVVAQVPVEVNPTQPSTIDP